MGHQPHPGHNWAYTGPLSRSSGSALSPLATYVVLNCYGNHQHGNVQSRSSWPLQVLPIIGESGPLQISICRGPLSPIIIVMSRSLGIMQSCRKCNLNLISLYIIIIGIYSMIDTQGSRHNYWREWTPTNKYWQYHTQFN